MLRHALLLLAFGGCVLGARLPMRRLVHSGKWLGAASERIIGGQDSVLGQFPYQVSLQYVGWFERAHMCGGSLITTTRVLGAASCMGGTYHAVAGVVDLETYEGDMQDSLVLEQIAHPDYPVGFGGIYPCDKAIYTLETAFTLNDYVQTIPVASAGSIPTADSSAVVTGWGATTNTSSRGSHILQWVNVTIIDYETCRELVDNWGTVGENFVVDTMVCTGPVTGGISICGLDYGGPLVQDGAVIGIAQWSHVNCGVEGAPSGYTRVSAFIDFIAHSKNIKDDQRRLRTCLPAAQAGAGAARRGAAGRRRRRWEALRRAGGRAEHAGRRRTRRAPEKLLPGRRRRRWKHRRRRTPTGRRHTGLQSGSSGRWDPDRQSATAPLNGDSGTSRRRTQAKTIAHKLDPPSTRRGLLCVVAESQLHTPDARKGEWRRQRTNGSQSHAGAAPPGGAT